MAITLTPNAASHVQRSISKRGKGVGLRVGVRKAVGMDLRLDLAVSALQCQVVQRERRRQAKELEVIARR